ncbi:MAG: VCBS repeat-containing protein [Planctomycetota bacterium]
MLTSTTRAALLLALSIASAEALGAQTPLLDDLHLMLPTGSREMRALALGDVDADGDLDAYCGNAGTFAAFGEQNRLYRNDGLARFEDATAGLPFLIDATRAAALADLDGDGNLDVLVGNAGTGGQANRLALGDGAGAFVDASGQLPDVIGASHGLAVGDVDGDGDLDALVGNFGQQDRLYVNDGAAGFANAAGQLPVDSIATASVALVDVDADGALDAWLGGGDFFGTVPIRLYANDGAGVFSDAGFVSPPRAALAITTGDVDADGDMDVVFGNGGGASPDPNELYLNDGSGQFALSAGGLAADANSTRAALLADVDGDLDLDLLVGNNGPNRVFLNDGSGVFAEAPAPLAPDDDSTHALVAADLDADGDLDAIASGGTGVHGLGARLYLGDGSGALALVTGDVPAASARTTDGALGDVDGDQVLDVVFAADDGSGLLLGDGTGFFAAAPSAFVGGPVEAIAVALGDVDGDQDLDALFGVDGQSRLYLGDGKGAFSEASAPLPLDDDTTLAVALADFDGDGDVDALLGNGGFTIERNQLLLNDGTGVFVQSVGQLPFVFDETFDLGLGDANGDGALDFAVANGGQNRLLLNDGAGTFTDAITGPALPFDFSYAALLADFDHDGDQDLFFGNTEQDRLYENDGTGVFADATALLPHDADVNQDAVALDFDQNGTLDLLLANDGANRLYLNDGSGELSLASTALIPDSDATRVALVGDLDGDGDADVFTGSYDQQDRVYRGLARQLAWRGVPRVGKPLALDLYGAPGTGWTLALALAPGATPLAPFGTLQLLPSSLDVVASGLLDGDGRAAFEAPVPADAGLIGLELFWQALLGSPLAFTNLEVTALSGL